MNTATPPDETPPTAPEENRHFRRPEFVAALEDRIAKALPLPANVFNVLKLIAIYPLLKLSLGRTGPVVEAYPKLLVLFFLLYILCDYLAEVSARSRGLDLDFGRVFDRVSDYPLIFILVWIATPETPGYLGWLKALADLPLLAAYLLHRGSPANRLRNGVNYAALISLLFLHEGWGEKLFTPELVGWLLVANAAFSATAALVNLSVLQKRFIADALSAANLLCGVISMIFAARHRFDVSLLFLMLGAAFDGFDGAAARKWGGTRWGVYSDDVADAVNYGLAPGVALFFAFGGIEGALIGAFYTVFTWSRLVFFTLNKDASDPEYFCGVPSTLGGLITLSSLVLFQNHPAVTGLMVGIACTLMVSFDTHYRHLGRYLANHKRAFFGMPFLIVILIAGIKFFGREAPAALILIASLAYSLRPTIMHMHRVVKRSPG